MAEKKRIELMDLVRLAAILLVLNSHFDALYPVPALATGGAAGNAVFFLLSGYFLKTRDSFLRFAWGRLRRLYPPMLLVVAFDFFTGAWRYAGFPDLISRCLWPTAFWFIGAIVLFDVLIYALEKLRFTERFGLFSAVMALLYAAAYVLIVDKTRWSVEDVGLKTPQQCFKLIYYFYIYAMGYALRRRGPGVSRRGWETLLMAACFLASFAVKPVFNRFPWTLRLQFTAQLTLVAFCWLLLRLLPGWEAGYRRAVSPRVRRAVSALAALSLEIYLVQFDCIRLCRGLPFPANAALTLGLALAAAWVLHRACGLLTLREEIRMSLKQKVRQRLPGLMDFLHEKKKEAAYFRRKHTDPKDYPKKLEQKYFEITGETMDINHPTKFSQKMQWLKLYDPSPLRTRLADRVAVRDWVREKIGEEYLIPIYGVYDRFEDIDFDALPDQFVMKTSHASGWNLVVKDKSKLDMRKARRQFHKWLSRSFTYWDEFEIHYNPIKPRIVIEKYMEDSGGELKDYKFMCFDGDERFVWVDFDRFGDHRRNVYDMDWKLQPWTWNGRYPRYTPPGGVPEPAGFDEMRRVAHTLCQGFLFVRVDLYDVDGKIYFGEMTFTSTSGFARLEPDEYETIIGGMVRLPIDEKSAEQKA